MTQLFDANDLNGVPGISGVTSDQAGVLERIVWGWLKPVLGLTDRPDTISDELFSQAIELGAIAHENPSGLSSYQLGAERYGYSSERRDAILESAGTGGSATGVPAPTGSFPPARSYPDPADICRSPW